MKPLLMHRDRDFDAERAPPDHAEDLTRDLALDALLDVLADGDRFIRDVARAALLAGTSNDVDTVLYRQAILADCLANGDVVLALYALAVDTLERRRREYFGGILGRYPGSVLHGSITLLGMLTGQLRRLREIAEAHGARFLSDGFRRFFSSILREVTKEYLEEIAAELAELRFNHGVLVTARLGRYAEGADYTLRVARDRRPAWLRRLLGKGGREFSFRIHPRDIAGWRAVGELRDRSINDVANALGQSVDHVVAFFDALRTELAFHLGCMSLHARLAALGLPTCFPEPMPAGSRDRTFRNLYDVSLALTGRRAPVGNTLAADGKSLVVITGPNTGGKSTFLRALGLAQLMLQCGMFVGADACRAETCTGVFTHYRREEDRALESGKLDEELARMSRIVDFIRPGALVLCNESFAATNEREGSEIARQIVTALLEKGVKVAFVTHQYTLAHGFYETDRARGIFLRAERRSDGTRSFKLLESEPLPRSHGEDLYRRIFETGDSPA